jgi:hypothetical protein
MISQFSRSNYIQLAITLSSNEALGILDSAYLEDYNGNDGILTLFHEATGTRYPLLMTELPDETPSIEHDVFRGYFVLSSKPDGLYWLQGRIRDVAGNYTILGAVASPNGTEQILNVGIEILTGIGIVKTIWLKLEGIAVEPIKLLFPEKMAIALEGLQNW